jgi:hypothetical protein
MATYSTITMQLPVHWACALLYGDDTGFEAEDQAHYDAFCQGMSNTYSYWACDDVSDQDPYFMRYHDAHLYGVLACNVTEMVFTVTLKTPKED